jgi:hypothetical protein
MVAVVSALAGCGPKTEGLDTSKIPDDLRDDYALFARRCSKCHSLARPLSAGITDDEQWVMYVNRMRRQPASGISLDDQDHILRFLRYYAAELRKKREDKGTPAPSASAAPPPASSGSAPEDKP